MNRSNYLQIRTKLAKDTDKIVDLEKSYCLEMKHAIKEVVDDLYLDFTDGAGELYPFWQNYPPEQRGRKPTGTSIPWLELGEKTISFNLVREIIKEFPSVRFPGLPTGGDIRFTTKDAFVHLDVKLTGPNDNPNEVVVPPNQVSGDGSDWKEGVLNSTWAVNYQRSGKINYHFQPKLPPFYVLQGKVLICVTMFLKAIYTVEKYGVQPLNHFELACVPNGLLMFDGPKLANTSGLIISGKDEKSKSDDTKRIRIRLEPLATIDKWRSVIISLNKGKWVEEKRNGN